MNPYQMVNGNPISHNDSTGRYDEAGHFYTTYMVAVATGKYSRKEAFVLAYYSQLPDEVERFDAVAGGLCRMSPLPASTGSRGNADITQKDIADRPWYKDIQEILHSLHGGPAKPRRKLLEDMIRENKLTPWERGMLIHAFADSYAHSFDSSERMDIEGTENGGVLIRPMEMAYGAPIGHFFQGHCPDIIGNDREKYKKYVMALFQALGGDAKTADSNAKLQAIFQFANSANPDDASMQRKAARRLAESPTFGYNSRYNPINGLKTNPGNPTPSESDVQSLMNKVKDNIAQQK